MVGEVGADDKVLVIRRVNVTYRLNIADEHRPMAERVRGIHAGFCPVARTIGDCVEISTALQFAGS